jgi:excisionase family DNA binding protein
MLTTQQAMKYLSVSMSTIHKWIKLGKIPAHRVGRNWRFYKDELDTWVKSGNAQFED